MIQDGPLQQLTAAGRFLFRAKRAKDAPIFSDHVAGVCLFGRANAGGADCPDLPVGTGAQAE